MIDYVLFNTFLFLAKSEFTTKMKRLFLTCHKRGEHAAAEWLIRISVIYDSYPSTPRMIWKKVKWQDGGTLRMQYIARRQRICGYIPYRQTQTMGQERRRRRGSVASFWGSVLLVISFLLMPSSYSSAIENRKKVKLHNVHGDCTRSLITAQAKAALFWIPSAVPILILSYSPNSTRIFIFHQEGWKRAPSYFNRYIRAKK